MKAVHHHTCAAVAIRDIQLPPVLYHGTDAAIWARPTDQDRIYVTADRSEAASYAFEAGAGMESFGRKPKPIVVACYPHELGDCTAAVDDGWTDAPAGSTWRDSLTTCGSLLIQGEIQTAKRRFHRVPVPGLDAQADAVSATAKTITSEILAEMQRDGWWPWNATAQKHVISHAQPTVWDINCGDCDAWADRLVKRVGRGDAYDVGSYDRRYLEKAHIVARIDGRYYDSQCPEGVTAVRLLPMIRNVPRTAYTLDYAIRSVT